MADVDDVAERVRRFRALHERGCFVLPNPWDVGSARLLESLGFAALATTSAGLAFTRGRPDAIGAVSYADTLAHLRELAAATSLPLNADFQDGFARDPEGVAAHVGACLATGVAGLSIEDATGQAAAPLYERSLAVERIGAARAAIDGSGTGVVLTARCEAWLVGDATPLRTALDRLVAFAAAGADVLFAPGVRDEAEIAQLVRAVAPKPLNVIVSAAPGIPVARLAELGVRRVSIGSALARVAWGAVLRAARELAERGTFGGFAEAAMFAELNGLFA